MASSTGPKRKKNQASPKIRFLTLLKAEAEKNHVTWNEELEKDIPNSWERHGDLILLSHTGFQLSVWKKLDNLWPLVASALGGKRVARKSVIQDTDYRSPQVDLLSADDGWVVHKDNGVRYVYDVTQCMFSAGNISEKLRIASWDCRGQTVVDMFAGIGYFTLPYLVNAKADLVYACEWNPAAVDALRRGLQLNRVTDRCIVLQGDNRQVSPKSVADHVNLGLIPSSEDSWPAACVALKPSGGVLHIHGNITSYRTSESEQKKSQPLKEELTPCVTSSNSEDTFHNNPKKLANITSNGISGHSEADPVFLGDSSVAPKCDRCGQNLKSHFANSVTHSEKPLTHSEKQVTHSKKLKPEWDHWAANVAHKIRNILIESRKEQWHASVVKIFRVKSYAPRIDHLVVDVRCFPCRARENGRNVK